MAKIHQCYCIAVEYSDWDYRKWSPVYFLALGLTVECRAHKEERKVSGGTMGYSIPPGY